MPTATTSTTKRATSSRSTGRKTSAGGRGQDGVALLKADHRAVEKLFGQFEKARDEGRKEQLAEQICMELRVHTQIEEEIFYPAAREALDDEDIINEAIVEHQAAKDLIAEIETMSPADEMYDAKVKVLQEQIEHHVQEEEKELFPKTQKSEMDLKAIGERLAARKAELAKAMGATPSTH